MLTEFDPLKTIFVPDNRNKTQIITGLQREIIHQSVLKLLNIMTLCIISVLFKPKSETVN